jgi:small subunit ribosomal protein S15
MSLTKEKKQSVIRDNMRKSMDTGSPEVQVALLTARINDLTDHFKQHVKDHHSRRGLIRMVEQRKSLLKYLERSSVERYKTLVTKLKLRK